ncbi:class I SAM-dependent methyltransferase [Marinicrinis sediminis]|uniref:Class I SAM-dependent methyltransferase n=1 Tax=Marinicrinis sediminis TaxID=1652465 RepID=A0ABW5RBH8_9BACL
MDYLEMLAKLGVGNAHPGGYSATLAQLEQWPIPPGVKVLEIGCGTGRTACLLAERGCHVTAVDYREDMIAKAIGRAKNQQSKVQFLQADARNLPFTNESFDIVLLESVTLFAGIQKPISEYFRVLKPGGTLYDREMMAMSEASDELLVQVKELYGFDELPTQDTWQHHFTAAGFGELQCWEPSHFHPDMAAEEEQYPDFSQRADEDTLLNQELWETASRYHQLMDHFADELGYGLFIAQKPPRSREKH